MNRKAKARPDRMGGLSLNLSTNVTILIMTGNATQWRQNFRRKATLLDQLTLIGSRMDDPKHPMGSNVLSLLVGLL